jgi:bacterial/archaeal transporter family-2 protein
VHVLGVVTMVAALILGQLLAALALDATGAFGLAVREISPTRVAAVALVAAGLVLSRV